MNESHWYALKVFYNRVFEIEQELNSCGLETYLPSETVVKVRNDGSRQECRRPVISSLVFFRATESRAIELQKQLNDRAMVYCRAGGSRCPAPIPDNEMNMFMLVTSSGEKGLEFLPAECEYAIGERVRVTGGPFEGAEGYIRRVKGNKRLIVSISGLCAVATSYIPRCFLEKATVI